ncbi:transcriptional regulator [Halobacillus sp. BBL2006]|uniref:transcriptional regulator n=1 Tax=Halobacillus sp. BBL2006 TaxID=1543706 RepID=UPI000541CDE9|nr:transcriptional regulator [Halobacillus sp. BBL2006]KHE73163.1 transcriptional regulator [Halobacillus sp. BBL2006]
MSYKIEPKKITFKKTEYEWFNYHETLREIARLREQIETPFDEDPEDKTIVKGANSAKNPGDPTGRIVTRLTTNKQLKYLTEVADAINRVYSALPDTHKRLAKLRYWSKTKDLTWDGIARELNISRRQAFYWRDEIVLTTIDELGWR